MSGEKNYSVRIANAGMYYDFNLVGVISKVSDGLVRFLLKDGTELIVGTHQLLWIQDKDTGEECLKRTGWIK